MDGLSIVYVTHRSEPRFEWFADSLALQLDAARDLAVEVVAVDGRLQPSRAAQFAAIVGGRFSLQHVAPKPSAVNGPHRLTRSDYHAAASARNTGVVHARMSHVAFVDDCAVLMPGWLETVRAAMEGGYVAAGAYEKAWDMEVEAGRLVGRRSEPEGRDPRWELGADGEAVPISGAQLFGCSALVPRSLLVAVNGFDEHCDTIGGEDWQLGVRLEWAGALICYCRDMFTVESEELHRAPGPVRRDDTLLDPAHYLRRLRSLGVEERTFPDEACDASHLLLDILYGRRDPRALGNHYDLGALTPAGLAATAAALPRTRWYDDRPLGDL